MTTRHAPTHTSQITKERARHNIEAKLSILKRWALTGIPWLLDGEKRQVRDADGELVLEWYPTSLVDFSLWDGSQNAKRLRSTFQPFTTNSRETLHKPYNADLKTAIEKTLGAVRTRADMQHVNSNKTNQVKKLQLEVVHWKSLAEAQAADAVKMRAALMRFEAEWRSEERARKNNDAELTRQLRDRDAKIAELTALLSKVVPLATTSTKR